MELELEREPVALILDKKETCALNLFERAPRFQTLEEILEALKGIYS